jgi:hypothetical protein
VDEFLKRLQSIAKWFEIQRRFHFYSSSLLLIYESDPKCAPIVDVRMIDFSHVFNDPTLDTNYVSAIKWKIFSDDLKIWYGSSLTKQRNLSFTPNIFRFIRLSKNKSFCADVRHYKPHQIL